MLLTFLRYDFRNKSTYITITFLLVYAYNVMIKKLDGNKKIMPTIYNWSTPSQMYWDNI